jgi:hypothetical protein
MIRAPAVTELPVRATLGTRIGARLDVAGLATGLRLMRRGRSCTARLEGEVADPMLSARLIAAVALAVVGTAFVVLAVGEGDVISAAAGILAIITGAILWFAAPRRRV